MLRPHLVRPNLQTVIKAPVDMEMHDEQRIDQETLLIRTTRKMSFAAKAWR
ncbi:MAG TPA: hypothetical protein VKP30_01465 [Polyangiaceae bacterium]|nr:hypothetical protein [Polyangiaceae bacterium]